MDFVHQPFILSLMLFEIEGQLRICGLPKNIWAIMEAISCSRDFLDLANLKLLLVLEDNLVKRL